MHNPALEIAWYRHICFLIDHLQRASAASHLLLLTQRAIPIVQQVSSTAAADKPTSCSRTSRWAIYLRATFAASRAYPEPVKQNAPIPLGFAQPHTGKRATIAQYKLSLQPYWMVVEPSMLDEEIGNWNYANKVTEIRTSRLIRKNNLIPSNFPTSHPYRSAA